MTESITSTQAQPSPKKAAVYNLPYEVVELIISFLPPPARTRTMLSMALTVREWTPWVQAVLWKHPVANGHDAYTSLCWSALENEGLANHTLTITVTRLRQSFWRGEFHPWNRPFGVGWFPNCQKLTWDFTSGYDPDDDPACTSLYFDDGLDDRDRPMYLLPYDVLEQIMSLLPSHSESPDRHSMMMVCKEWANFCITRNWREPDLRDVSSYEHLCSLASLNDRLADIPFSFTVRSTRESYLRGERPIWTGGFWDGWFPNVKKVVWEL